MHDSTPSGLTLSPARQRFALVSLALGGFGLGASEFVSMGLLPQISEGLLGEAYRVDPAAGVARGGWLISAYALGVVVGAPLFGVLGARFRRSRLLVALLGLLALGTLASAFAPTFETAVLARFAAGLPHGAYFGAAALVAGSLMGPGNQGRGIAIALSGLTIANVIGVPVMTVLGQAYGWRLAYVLAAAVFAATLVAVRLSVPRDDVPQKADIRGDLRAFGRAQVWLVLGIGAIGGGGFFAVYSYLAEVTTRVTGLASGMVPWVLATVGVGMVIGNALGGRAADKDGVQALLWGLAALMVIFSAFALLSGSTAGLFAMSFLVGLGSMFVNPAMQSRLINAAKDAPLLAASLNHSAFNVGNSLGAALGGVVIAAGFGYRAPAVVGVGLVAVGLLITLVSIRVERREAARVAAAAAPDAVAQDAAGPAEAPAQDAAGPAQDAAAAERALAGVLLTIPRPA